MDIKVKYESGVFKPLQIVKGLKEGEELSINFDRSDFHQLLVQGSSFDFLKEEPDLYTDEDIIEFYSK